VTVDSNQFMTPLQNGLVNQKSRPQIEGRLFWLVLSGQKVIKSKLPDVKCSGGEGYKKDKVP
jgi:hypothetical protein